MKEHTPEYGRKLTAECPRVIGLMVSALQSGNSIDNAIRSVSAEGPELSAELFSKCVRTADCRKYACTEEALEALMSDLPDTASRYRRSIRIVLSAASSSDRTEERRLMDEACESSLEAVRIMGDRYCASLNTPCLTVYGMGIMLPMMLMSILPLLGMGGLFSVGGLDSGVVSAITLVVIPAVLVCICIWMRTSNPFIVQEKTDAKRLYPLLLSVPLCAFNYIYTGNVTNTVILGIAPAIVIALILDIKGHRAEIKRRKCEDAVRECFTDMGEMMQEGMNCDTAVDEALRRKSACDGLRVRLAGSMSVSRGDWRNAVKRSLSPVSSECAQSVRDVMECAEKDNDDAGRLAIMLGRQYRNRKAVTEGLAIRLKSLTDMMLATAAVFAPMVLGMSVAILGPMSELTGYDAMENVGTVLGLYLIELCAIISVLISNLKIDDVRGNVLWRFSVLTPMSLLVFTVCSAISI